MLWQGPELPHARAVRTAAIVLALTPDPRTTQV